MTPDTILFLRSIFPIFAGATLFQVCRHGFDRATTAREERFWAFAAIVSVLGSIWLMLASASTNPQH